MLSPDSTLLLSPRYWWLTSGWMGSRKRTAWIAYTKSFLTMFGHAGNYNFTWLVWRRLYSGGRIRGRFLLGTGLRGMIREPFCITLRNALKDWLLLKPSLQSSLAQFSKLSRGQIISCTWSTMQVFGWRIAKPPDAFKVCHVFWNITKFALL